MKRTCGRLVVGLMAGAIFTLTGAGSALAAPLACDATTGVPGAGECQITTTKAVTGPIEVDRTLHIFPTGRIDASNASNAGIQLSICVAPATVFSTCDLILDTPNPLVVPPAAGGGQIEANDIAGNDDASPITINVSRDVLMNANSAILAENKVSGGSGAAIVIHVGGDMTMNANATISSGKTSGAGDTGVSGPITITVGDTVNHGNGKFTMDPTSQVIANGPGSAGAIAITAGLEMEIDGLVQSWSTLSGGGGANQGKGGAPVTLKSGCKLDVSSTGLVSSRGQDPGADLVHLEGCTVSILGKVESFGSGHVVPRIAGVINNKCNDDAIAHPVGGRSDFFTACVEIWAGTTLTVLGEVKADTGLSGGTNGRGWIDLFARGDLSITGPAVTGTPTYAVHANGGIGVNTDDGGLITVKSSGGKVSTTGAAMQANSTSAGGWGGNVNVEASQNIEFGTASLQAMGAPAGSGMGGHMVDRSWNGVINGAAPGELNVSAATVGVVDLTATSDPGASYAGNVTAGSETDHVAPPGGNPVIPANVPLATCQNTCNLSCSLTVTKTLVPSSDSGRFNLVINGTTYTPNAGDGGSTGPQVCLVGLNNFGETAGTVPVTDLTKYTTTINGADCVDGGNGTGTITMALGQNKVCNIVNTRKPTLKVTKILVPTNDTGLFNLQIDGSTAGTGANVGNNGTTGAQIVTIGAHTAGETAGTGTSLANYTTVIGGDCAADGSVTVAAGDNKECTITNRRDPTLKVTKILVPANDPGLFNLQIDGSTAGTGANVGNNGTTGAQIVTVGQHTAGETAGTGTALASYNTVIGGDCAANGSVTVAAGESKECTITNTRKPGLTVNKILVPANDPGLFNLQIDGATAGTGANVGNGGTTGPQVVAIGGHTAGETAGNGTNLADYVSVIGGDCNAAGAVTVGAGDSKVCTITNTRKPRLTVNKVLVPANDPGLFNLQIDGSTAGTGANVGNGGTTGAQVVSVGLHTAAETAGNGTNLADYVTAISGDCAADGSVSVAAGDNKVCTITNTRKPRLTVNKVLLPTNDPGLFNLQIDGSTAGTGANVGNGGTTGAQVVTVGAHTAGETAGNGTILAGYTTTIGGDCAANGSVTLAAGDNKVCTITNTRNPRLTVNKILVPANDPGLFNLQIDGSTAGTGANVGNGGTTGAQLISVGAHTAGETAGNGTNLADYTTVIGGDCAANGSVTLAVGDNKVCTITNTRKPRLTVNKILVPANDPGLFNLQIDGSTAGTGANVGNGGTTGAQAVTVGGHSAGETAGNGTNLSDYITVIGGDCAANGSVTVAAGDNKVCTITNTRKPRLTVNKVLVPANDPGLFNLQIDGSTAGTGANVGNGGTTGAQVVTIGAHSVGETAGNGTNLTNYTFVIGGDCAANGAVTLAAGDNKVCTITNTRSPDTTLRVIKTLVPSTDTGKFNLQIDGATAGTGANVGNGGTTGVVVVAPGVHTAGETAGTATNLGDYISVIGGDCAANGSVTLALGENKLCTITNTRKPRLTVVKTLVPSNDTGKFNLQIDGSTAGTGANVGNGGTTGAQVVTIGAHAAGETAGTSTSLTDYNSVIGGACAANGSVTLAAGDDKVCTITNTRKAVVLPPPELVVIKQLVPTSDPGKFNLQIDGITRAANVGNGGTTGTVVVTEGKHIVGETAGTGTSLGDYIPGIGGDCAPDGSVTLVNGDHKVCIISNAQSRSGESGNPPQLVVIKILSPPADPGKFNLQINGITRGTGANVGNFGTTGSVVVLPGTHIVGETAGTGADLADYLSVIGGDCAANGSVTVVEGDTKICTITNVRRVSVTPFEGGGGGGGAGGGPPADIPALDPSMLAALGMLLAVGGAWALRRRESVAKTRRN